MSNLDQIKPLDDFNWESYEEGNVESSAQKEKDNEAYDKTLNQVQEHEVVEGTVIAINKREVLVDIGYKSDGIISAN